MNEARYGLPTNPELRPEDATYTSSDIRNVCEIAWRLNCSLVDATRFLVPVATLDPDGLASLRKLANGRFLSASSPGLYREGRVTTEPKRRLNVQENDYALLAGTKYYPGFRGS